MTFFSVILSRNSYRILIFYLLIIQSCFCKSYDLKYDISHQIDNRGAAYLRVSLTIDRTSLTNIIKENSFTLIFPNNWSSAKNLINNIRNIRSVNSEIKIKKGYLSDEKIIYLSNSIKNINITYDVYPSEELTLFKPIINKEIFHFIGHTVLAYPAFNNTTDPLSIIFNFSNLKDNISTVLSNGLGDSNLEQRLTLPLQKILHTAYAGGKYEKILSNDDQDNLVLLTYGMTSENQVYLNEVLKKIITFQRKFWQDNDFPHYLVTSVSNNHIPLTFSGTYTANAISLLVNEASPFFREDLPFILAHEHWHT